MNTEDLFDKHSTTYYDANEQKTDVLTMRRFNNAINEILEVNNLEIKVLKDALFIRKEIINGCDKKLKEFETELSLYHTFTNWLNEELDNIDTNYDLSHDFVSVLKNRLLLIIEQQNNL